MAAVARMEHMGVPIDVATLHRLQTGWSAIKLALIREVDKDYGVYDGQTFKTTLFEEWLSRNHLPWPRLPSGRLALDDDTFRQMARAYPEVAPLRELRHALGTLRLNNLRVGTDGRNRCMLSPFRSKTGRNQPSNAKFIFGPSRWLRGLIKPAPGYGIAYLDFGSQEIGIERLHVNWHMGNALRSIDENHTTYRVNSFGQHSDGVNRSENVRHVGHGDDLCTRVDNRINI